jgi:hypothetical protein
MHEGIQLPELLQKIKALREARLRVLTQNSHLVPSTQQDEQAGLTREQIPKRASQFS